MQDGREKLLYAEHVIKLLELVRVATIKECVEKVKIVYKIPIGININIYINKDTLLNLDINSIEL